jgi:galactokinase
VGAERAGAFAPGRVNLIGEHTDYNRGLALPFAIAEGVTVYAHASSSESRSSQLIEAYAQDLQESDEFALEHPAPAAGWRAFVRGTVAELIRAGHPLRGARLEISGNVPQGAGLSSSAALEVALCLALIALGSDAPLRSDAALRTDAALRSDAPLGSHAAFETIDRMEIAQLCARVENHWVGAHTGLLDQLASLYGAADTALCIDFATLAVEAVPLALKGWRLVILDSGERHVHASSGYNERRAECAAACELLGIASLREASLEALGGLPEPLGRRAGHVLTENERVRATVAALRGGDLAAVGALLDASHASLRESYEVSTPAVEATVQRLRRAGAAGARMVGGGFGGSVLGLFDPDTSPPPDAYEVHPGPGAHRLAR